MGARTQNLLKPAGDNAPVIRSDPAVTEIWCKGISRQKERQIKIAVEGTCELCREYTPLPLLELHGIACRTEPGKPGPKEREKNILVVCATCHRHIHELPVPEERLRALIDRRPFALRREILQALGYKPKKYSPPEGTDIGRVFEETTRGLFAGNFR